MAHDVYNGIAGNITAAGTPAISSSTNASPIEVTTATAHGFSTGDEVAIIEHKVNTNANGIWPITVTSSTKFRLVGSTGNGIGGATGTAQGINLGTTDMVTDGNDPLAAEWTVPDAAGLDRTVFLWRQIRYQFQQTVRAGEDAATVTLSPTIVYVRIFNVSQNSTYTLPNPAVDGLCVVVSRISVGSGFAAAIRRADATLIGTLPDTGASWIRYVSFGGLWTAFEWGGNATNLA